MVKNRREIKWPNVGTVLVADPRRTLRELRFDATTLSLAPSEVEGYPQKSPENTRIFCRIRQSSFSRWDAGFLS